MSTKLNFKRLSAQIRLEISKFRRKNWESFCNSYTPSDGKLWKAINSIDTSNKNKLKQVRLMNQEGILVKDPKEIANMFADYLKEVFKEPNFDAGSFQIVSSMAWSLFRSNETVPELKSPEVIKLLIKKQIGSKGALGSDGITNMALKYLPPNYCAKITSIVNASMELAHVRAQWKRALVTMIPKPLKDNIQKSNYRPICLLETLS